MEASDKDGLSRGYGAVLWRPDEAAVRQARITHFMRWLADGHGPLTRPAQFWTAIWDYFDVLGDWDRDPASVLAGDVMPDVRWFGGPTVNYARNALRTAWTDPGRTAIVFDSERARRGRLTYAELAEQVARVARGLAELGVGRGDRVAALLRGVPEAIIGLLAAASLGAIWSSCSPDFGARSVVDRFAQIEPAVLIACDGYVYAVVYSSGTTGLPKPIMHGHGGIVLEHFKAICLQQDLRPGDVFAWYTTTGWVMWNYLAGALQAGVTIVLYDGSATYPGPDRLWRLAAEHGVSLLGVGAPYLVGPCPLLPVRAGVISGRWLGALVRAYDAAGPPVTGEVGELVVTAPMPSMPVGFTGDPDGARYRESYFEQYPGVWRHGDWIELLPDGGCVIYGRSDATLNRGEVRMGTSEFYRVVEAEPGVADSLVVDTGRLGEPGRLVLYVVPAPGCQLDDDLTSRLRVALRAQLSPRHVPEEIHQVPAIPRTLSGKKLEVPVRKILLGLDPDQAADASALADPAALAYFGRFRGHPRGS